MDNKVWCLDDCSENDTPDQTDEMENTEVYVQPIRNEHHHSEVTVKAVRFFFKVSKIQWLVYNMMLNDTQKDEIFL